MAAGPDGFRDPLPNGTVTFAGRHPTRVLWIVGPIDSIFSLEPCTCGRRAIRPPPAVAGRPHHSSSWPHTMRAILLAKATAASLRGLRLSKLSSHCEGAGRPVGRLPAANCRLLIGLPAPALAVSIHRRSPVSGGSPALRI